jgi:hypothetical protein
MADSLHIHETHPATAAGSQALIVAQRRNRDVERMQRLKNGEAFGKFARSVIDGGLHDFAL